MARIKITVDKPLWRRLIDDNSQMSSVHRKVSGAAVGALIQVANDAVKEGREQIASSGRFSDQLRRTIRAQDTWLSGLKARMQDVKGPGGGPSLQAKALVFHTIGLAAIFEHGATIMGKPMLWIPIDPRAPPASRSGKKLTYATVRGTPVLFDANDRDRHRRPLYIGTPSVRIPKKWRIVEIVKEHAGRIGEQFLRRFRGG